MATKLEVAKFLFGAAGQSSPGERAGTLAGGGNTTVRYGTVKTVDGTSVTILMEDTGETLYTMTTTPVAVGDRVAIIKNGQSVVVYATDQLVEMINKTVVDGDAEYAVGDDAYTAPKSGWSTTMPDVEQGEYLWMRYTTTLKDGTVKTSTPVCLTSAGGLVITSSEVSYAIGTSGTTPPSSGWQSTPPTAKPGQYLWSREVTNYSDGTFMTSYGVSYQGTNGQNGQDGAAGADGKDGVDGADGADGKDGVGIEDSDVTWQKSSSGTTPPTGTWLQSPPDLNPGDYLWTRTVWTYTDGSSTTAYSVSKAGDTGPQGIQGPPGENGEPRYTWIKYADNASGDGMSDKPDGKTYMGIAYNKESPTESGTASDYAWSLIKGADGQQGIQGPPGEDGKPTYTWIKYADDDQGTGMTDNPDGKDYIGIAYNKDTPTESPTATDYAWSLIKGETGVGIDKVRDMYYLSTSDTQVTGGTWVYDECPEWQEGRYIWTRMEITYDDGTVKQTDPVLMSALNQANENAAKVTWYVSSDDDGLHISSVKDGPNEGFNVLLTGNSLKFRNGTSEIGAYTGQSIYLGGENGLRLDYDELGTVAMGADTSFVFTSGQPDGIGMYPPHVSVDRLVEVCGYSALTTLVSDVETDLQSSDQKLRMKRLTEFDPYGMFSYTTAEGGVRIINPRYQQGGTVTVELSASMTAGDMSSGKNLALSIFAGRYSNCFSNSAVAVAINSSGNIMTSASIAPFAYSFDSQYLYVYLVARTTGGGGVADDYDVQKYAPRLTVRVVSVDL